MTIPTHLHAGLLDGSVTTIVERMEPQVPDYWSFPPAGFFNGQLNRFYCMPDEESIPCLHQPGDTFTIDGVEFEVVSVGYKQIGDLTTTQVRTVYPDWEYRDSQWPNPDDWVWVYEVKGVDDE